MGESALFLAGYLFLGAWLQDALYFALAVGIRRAEAVDALLVAAPIDAVYAAFVGVLAVMVYRALR